MALPRATLWTYLVGWDDQHIIKAGITMRNRWRTFCTRGATLKLLHLADEAPGSWVYLESRLEGYLMAHLAPAFPAKADAAPYLGSRGAGYLECYRAESPDAYSDALAACARIMREHPGGGQCGIDMHALMHGRTNARTYGDPHSPSATNPLFSDAHAHIRGKVVDK